MSMASPRRSRLANEVTIFDEAEESEPVVDQNHDEAGDDADKLHSAGSIEARYDRTPSPAEDPYDYSRPDSAEDETSFNDTDPFTETDESERDEESAEEDNSFDNDAYPGIEPTKPLSYTVSHQYDRSFSSTTAIHLDDPEHPGHHESFDKQIPFTGDERKMLMLCDATTLVADSRHHSDSYSVMPEDVGPPLTPTSKHRIQTLYSPTPRHDSTPKQRPLSQQLLDHDLNTPMRDRLLSSTRARDGSSHRRPVFRNPSSVRAMQMSSPPPFPGSPRSARQRRIDSAMSMSQDGGSVHRRSLRESSPRHPNPKKEYPLMLLHCSVSISPLPYALTILQAVLSSDTLEDLALLREKAGQIVLERGLLIPHPGDDYELLEERVLETLELKTPRIGKCGHYASERINVDGGKDTVPPVTLEHDIEQTKDQVDVPVPENVFDGARKCSDCKRHIASEILDSQIASHRRWDIKVYAANGLMRAGAWNTAWREMEKIDLEVGVFISDELRRRLDEQAREEGLAESGHNSLVLIDDPNFPAQGIPDDLRRTVEAPMPPSMARQRSTNTDPASTAAISRIPSTSDTKQSKTQQTASLDSKDQLPLSTLLVNYIQHNVRNKPEVIFGIAILLLGIVFSSRNVLTTSKPLVVEETIPYVPSPSTDQQKIVDHTKMNNEPMTTTVVQSITLTTTGWNIPACTFAPEELEMRDMTALPREAASSVLEAVATATSFSLEPTGTETALSDASQIEVPAEEVPTQVSGRTASASPSEAESTGLVEQIIDFVSGGDDEAETMD